MKCMETKMGQEFHITPQPGDALILIDVQHDFLPGGALAVPEGDQILPAVEALADLFDQVILTQDWHPAGHSSFASSHTGRAPFEQVAMPYGGEPPRAKPRGFPAVSGGIEPPPTAEVFCHIVDAAAGAAGLGRRKSQRASSSAACRSASHSAPSRARNRDPERCPLSTVPVRQSVLLE